jgi:S-disulfanyl-L-cysteine oxidoreductase SoxD
VRAIAFAALPLILCAAAASGQSAESDSSRSAADGAYTATQATQGETVFASICGSCHSTSEFSGPTFRRIWSGRSVHDLFDQLRNTMPLDNPGGLTREQYANVVAYLLKLNAYPAGNVALPSSDDGLKQVKF